MHNKKDMKHDAGEPATKGDLERFATKDDLERFATKVDMELFAIKDDLGRFATKTDLTEFKDEMRQEMRGFKNRVALDALEVRSDVGALGEKLSKLILQTHSDLMGAVESAVFKAEKVDRAQILTGDRIGLLEGRVAALESPRPQHP